MTEIYIDADACPVKEEILKVADRHDLMVHMVSDGGIRPYANPKVRVVIVTQGAALATRNLMADLRETGTVTGGPAPFSKQDRSRFLQALEKAIQAGLQQ